MSIRFTQSCPTCGRRVQVRASLIGCSIECQHCHAEFEALAGDSPDANSTDRNSMLAANQDEGDPLMARVDRALKRAASHLPLV